MREAYRIVDEYEIIVSIHSTLGYEAFSRGSKVAIFSGIKGDNLMFSSRVFGWPGDIPKEGYFWTNSVKPSDWKDVILRMIEVECSEWDVHHKSFGENIMSSDINNVKFLSLMKKLNIPLCDNKKI